MSVYAALQQSLGQSGAPMRAHVAGVGEPVNMQELVTKLAVDAANVKLIQEKWDQRFPALRDRLTSAFAAGTDPAVLLGMFNTNPDWTRFFYAVAATNPGVLPWLTTWSKGSWINERLPYIIQKSSSKDVEERLFNVIVDRGAQIANPTDVEKIKDSEETWEDLRDQFTARMSDFLRVLETDKRTSSEWLNPNDGIRESWVKQSVRRMLMFAMLVEVAPELVLDVFYERSNRNIQALFDEWLAGFDDQALGVAAAYVGLMNRKNESRSSVEFESRGFDLTRPEYGMTYAQGTESLYQDPEEKARFAAAQQLAKEQASASSKTALIVGAVIVVVILIAALGWAAVSKSSKGAKSARKPK